MGMTVGILVLFPGLLGYCCLIQNTHHQLGRFHLPELATQLLLENTELPRVPVNRQQRHPGQSQETWGPGLILIPRITTLSL